MTRPRTVHRPGRETRGGVAGLVPGASSCRGVPEWTSPPGRARGCQQVRRAGPRAVASSARKRCELDPRPAPPPLNIAVSIFESQPPHQGRTARAEDERLTRRSHLFSKLPTSPGNRIREPVQARAAPAKVLARALGYMTQRAHQSGSWAANAKLATGAEGSEGPGGGPCAAARVGRVKCAGGVCQPCVPRRLRGWSVLVVAVGMCDGDGARAWSRSPVMSFEWQPLEGREAGPEREGVRAMGRVHRMRSGSGSKR